MKGILKNRHILSIFLIYSISLLNVFSCIFQGNKSSSKSSMVESQIANMKYYKPIIVPVKGTNKMEEWLAEKTEYTGGPIGGGDGYCYDDASVNIKGGYYPVRIYNRDECDYRVEQIDNIVQISKPVDTPDKSYYFEWDSDYKYFYKYWDENEKKYKYDEDKYNKELSENPALHLGLLFQYLNKRYGGEDRSEGNSIIVYIDNECNIDLTHVGKITIKTFNLTLASNRGLNGSSGALLYMTDPLEGNPPLIKILASNVRITGLRILGPFPGVWIDKYTPPLLVKKNDDGTTIEIPHIWPIADNIGIACGYENKKDENGNPHDQVFEHITVDNCEISSFLKAAINIHRAKNVYIHHNRIHHNQCYFPAWRSGEENKGGAYAYGVNISGEYDVEEGDPVDVYIEANIFDSNKHSIAGSGEKGQSYEARYNLVLWNAPVKVYNYKNWEYKTGELQLDNYKNNHCFDMHRDANTGFSGRLIKIHHNWFLKNDKDLLINIKGKPSEGYIVKCNKFVQRGNILEVNGKVKKKYIKKYNKVHFNEALFCDPTPCRDKSCLSEEEFPCSEGFEELFFEKIELYDNL